MLTGPGGIPCVLPTPMVPAALLEDWATVGEGFGGKGVAYNPHPYDGGDHYHLIAPDTWLHA